MIRELNLRNFRAFKTQSFEFSKINIFVGPNNSGKSSALSAINLLSQTVNSPTISRSPLVLNGPFDSLGTFLDLVHGNRSNTPLGIDLKFDTYELRLDYKFRQQRREIELVRFELLEKNIPIISYVVRKDSFSLKVKGRDFEEVVPGSQKRRPNFFQLMIMSSIVYAPRLHAEKGVLPDSVQIELLNIERALNKARRSLQSTFGRFDSVGPFRDRPLRTYLYSGETAERIGISGSNTALILSSDNSRRGAESRDMMSEISRWFKVSGIAEAVRIKSLTPRHFEIALEEIDGSTHNICDVGFGCSQVLPVLTAALNLFGGFATQSSRSVNPMFVIQEPEIHLHPNAQAALGSFFAGLLKPGGQLFVETHSDNFVLRVARHVADGTLSADDVKIFYVHKETGVSKVEKIVVSEDGRFVPEWPGGFFPQRQSESLNLARASLAFQTRELAQTQQLEFRYPEEK